jgi:hypothetical protein
MNEIHNMANFMIGMCKNGFNARQKLGNILRIGIKILC